MSGVETVRKEVNNFVSGRLAITHSLFSCSRSKRCARLVLVFLIYLFIFLAYHFICVHTFLFCVSSCFLSLYVFLFLCVSFSCCVHCRVPWLSFFPPSRLLSTLLPSFCVLLPPLVHYLHHSQPFIFSSPPLLPVPSPPSLFFLHFDFFSSPSTRLFPEVLSLHHVYSSTSHVAPFSPYLDLASFSLFSPLLIPPSSSIQSLLHLPFSPILILSFFLLSSLLKSHLCSHSLYFHNLLHHS